MSVWGLINEGVKLFKNKKFDEAIEKLNQALDGIENKNSQIQEQNDIQFWLGRCYLEQAKQAEGKESEQLFGQAVEHHQQQLRLAEQLTDEQNSIQEQIYAQSWLGRCYFEQAKQAEGKEAAKLFERAVEHRQRRLELAEQLTDEQNSIQEQIYAQSWLGRCYFEQAKQAEGKEAAKLFERAVEHRQRRLELAEQLTDEQNSIQEQIYAQSWLGRCYFEQAKQAEGKEAAKLFERAVEHHQQQLRLAEQLEDKQNNLQEQINAQAWLGRCYFEQAMKAKGKESEQLFEQAVKHRQQQLRLAEQLADKQNSLQEQNNAQSWLGRCYFKQAIIQKKWERYFEWKKQKIQGDLFETKKGDLINAITTILAVLNIPPMELGSTPLAHYTSPSVCERLFDIVSDETNDKTNDNYPVDNNKVSPMRIGSSTYMNDPTEGEGLLELLNLQDLKLENKADCPVHNAFFTCFSSRVNDLNQFRLYGKENSVEASGCCLVFNKSGDWLKEPDVSASFKSFTNKQNEGFKEPIEADVTGSKDENLPLYQVAYIAYYDEYIAKEKCGKWLLNKNNQSFGIRLKPIGKNPSWHQFRIKKLEEALIGLIEKSNNISDENSKALEYIRYLFKDFAFRDEEEFRLLKIEQIGSDKIEYCPTTKSVYLPYADIRDIVDEVILGTNYEKSGNNRKAEVFQHLMRKHYPNVKVSRSSLPINANLPIRKE
ncbi:sel1 repeat family protein [Eikenella halliae]|uniref:sel1 repeat family protein n=1 Tax=Eikenella halliae TaxID=1795832 RepID=UPI00370D798E